MECQIAAITISLYPNSDVPNQLIILSSYINEFPRDKPQASTGACPEGKPSGPGYLRPAAIRT